MIGRAAYDTPFMFATADRDIFHEDALPPTREQVVRAMLPYIEHWTRQGTRLHSITRHMLHLFHGQPGSRIWKRTLTEGASVPGADAEVVANALDQVLDAVKDAIAHQQHAYQQACSQPTGPKPTV